MTSVTNTLPVTTRESIELPATSSVRDRTPFFSVSPGAAYILAWWSVVALEVVR